MTYPSGRIVTYGFDSANRILTATGTFGTQTTNYTAGNIAYTAAGGFSSVPLGNGIMESYGWNDRLQQTSIAAGNLLGLSFYPCDGGLTACTSNTGNIWRETISIGGTVQATQEYRYDALNRLTLADERAGAAGFTPACQDGSGVWAEQYSYDAFGNRAVPCQSSNLSGLTWEVASVSSYSASTNRITGWGYDAAGSINATPAGQSVTYDAESRQTQFCGAGSSGCEQYVYDGDGRRVQKTGTTGTVTYVYDAAGNLAAEYGGTAAASGTQYLTADHLGSTRLVTNATGAVSERHDYVPFGYELSGGWRTTSLGYGPETVRQQFTGQERDAETGNDFFQARYFSGAQGRFTSPDEPLADQDGSDPQSWNLYSYVRNNPLAGVDPTGTFEASPWIPWRVGGFMFQLMWDTMQLEAQQAQQVAHAVATAVDNFRQSPGCPAAVTLGVAGAGAGAGYVVGGVGAGAAGGVGGTFVAPGVTLRGQTHFRENR